MNTRLLATSLLLLAAACDGLPGRPRAADRPLRPAQIADFDVLYARSCAGCHGDTTRPGAASPLTDPTYLALVDDATVRRVTAAGVAGTAMPAFDRDAGGALTGAQVDVIARGLRERFGGRPAEAAQPPYAAPPGDAARGAQLFATRCASCHGPDHSVTDPAYLALVSDQALRTAILVGRPALGMPGWRGDGKTPALSAQDVADLVGWLVAQRRTDA